MAKKKKEEELQKDEVQDVEPKEVKPKKVKSTFTKEQFKTSERYHYKQDLIEVLLDPYLKYTIEEVDKLIDEYMESEAR
ncbi:hypothetical protein PN296_04270 [Peptostreptococcus anaerobius]|uniref:hypothetical protein n=1 Tax=Peptostreptococcus TaxID=1257 RepID=UPI00189BBC35|nr:MULTISPECIES: hypothetical protein [Peptostreptococcus]MDB8821379.1 hypothetical protein [Peptostreptococcus anaerobius]MDB8825975.1 hypothetical protein [Peptostreptococcus anaerobius]MDB8827864.1 hypothetical protein [Peptostreptococcus anaerobius]MDB8829682.1 hypothetical protein [Peptostreptococcus anaerobius]MDB8831544.1 hypothetical protein [Peptostreptococcus anaerobius]